MEDKDPKTGKRDRAPLSVQIQQMTVPERIRLAMFGAKEARTLLMQDSNRVVQLAVLDNPKVTTSEVAAYANSRSVTEDVLRKIAANREWIKLYPIRLALVKNPKTPVGIAVKLVNTLLVQDLKLLSKSKAVSSVVVQAAKRKLSQKQA
ncbi:hypothetical protein SAMN02746041_00809 [Desulfacinum hydrothermale DSM 13146]|uniref:Leucine rich repeat variant n=1 Tax=Desulfacinum hydrothermale DSM 13146 TaxID=1121390 RepID=A0A1W1X7Z1_9BACT|nr:hypothetical protein [Desulfacinum hydrothermale]SMC20095.1 hypothetical protein SAMN02746041_00809 [Desulfacinum hydrothermale DSM 13146]